MRVGVDIGPFSPDPKLGGQFTFVAEVVRGLRRFIASRRSQHDYVMLHSGSERIDDPNVSFVALDGLLPPRRGLPRLLGRAVRRLSAGRVGWFRDATKAEQVNRAIASHGLDLIWSIAPTATVRAPFVSTVWDLDHRTTPFFPEVSRTGHTWDEREALYASSLPKSAYVVTGTETGRKAIAWFYRLNADRIKVIPFPTPSFALAGGVEPDNGVFAKLGFRPDEKYVFYPAQFWPHKNHVNLLRAIRALAESGRGTCKVVFSGSDKGNLGFVRRYVEANGLAGQVSFAGFVSIDELVALYRNSLALVFTSYMGFDNLPPLEAMGLGCPCIVSDIPGHRDQLGDAATYADPNDVTAIAERIHQVDSDRGFRDDLIRRGLARAGSWQADDYVAAIDACVTEFAGYRANWASGLDYSHT